MSEHKFCLRSCSLYCIIDHLFLVAVSFLSFLFFFVACFLLLFFSSPFLLLSVFCMIMQHFPNFVLKRTLACLPYVSFEVDKHAYFYLMDRKIRAAGDCDLSLELVVFHISSLLTI